MNTVKAKLKAGETAIGTTAGSTNDSRFLANAGFDFLLFDTQHSPDEIKQLGRPVAAMRGADAIPIIRVGENRQDQICYALDQGAKGIISPMINTPEMAKQMISWCKYPFEGERSSAGPRGEWGEYKDYREYMDIVNEHLLILPMIETVEALEAIDDILAVGGIDVLLVGPSDLSIALDVALDYTSDTYINALGQIGEACNKAGVAAGMFFVPPGISPAKLSELGFRFYTLPWQGWASEGIKAGIDAIR
jgi:4-hydroxy-2-oxoheptanedioate aldolase